MPARHYALEYNVNNGPWLLGRADEAPGPGKEFEVPGLPVGTHAVKLRLAPLTGDPTPIVSNEVILQVGQPGISEPVQTVALAEVTLADVVVRRDTLLAAAGVEVSPQDAQTMNEALLSAAGVTAEVVDNLGIRSYDDVESSADVTAVVADALVMQEVLQSTVVTSSALGVVQTMLEQVQAAIAASAVVTDGIVRSDAVTSAATVVADLGSEVYTPGGTGETTIYADSAFSYPANTIDSWSVVRGATQSGAVITDNLLISTERFWNVDEFEERVIVRAGIAFAVPQGAALTSAILHLYVESLYWPQDQPQISVQESAHDAVTANFADYDAFPGAPNGTSFGNTVAVSAGQSYSITLNASGLAYLNSIRTTGGTAKLMLREYGHDFQNVEPGSDQVFTAYMSMPNHAVQSQRPRLVVS